MQVAVCCLHVKQRHGVHSQSSRFLRVLTSLPIQFSSKDSAHQHMFLPAEIPKVAFQMQQSFQAACQEALGDLLTLVEQHVAIETRAGQGSPAALAQFFAIKFCRSSTMPFISFKRRLFHHNLTLVLSNQLLHQAKLQDVLALPYWFERRCILLTASI